MSNLTLRAELKQIIFEAYGEESALFMSQPIKGTEIVMPDQELIKIGNRTVQAILATVSKHLPEKRTAMMVTHCPHCSRNVQTVEEEYNEAITEMKKILGEMK